MADNQACMTCGPAPGLCEGKGKKTFKDGVWENNPISIQMLGVCSALAVTNKLENSLVCLVVQHRVVTVERQARRPVSTVEDGLGRESRHNACLGDLDERVPVGVRYIDVTGTLMDRQSVGGGPRQAHKRRPIRRAGGRVGQRRPHRDGRQSAGQRSI